MKKYRLLPVQVENLERQYCESVKKMQKLNEAKNDAFAENKASAGKEFNFGLDASLLGSLSIVSSEYKDAKEKLENHEVVTPNNSDIIGLGSTFELNMNYGDLEETEVFTLVEVHNSKDDHNFISMSSPLGMAVTGKTVGDKIGYMVGNTRITGEVTGIIKENQKTF